jgi:hypothetical protein
MKIASWRNATLVLAVVCCYQRWHSCTHSHASTKPASSEASSDGDSATSDSPSASSGFTRATPIPSLPAEPGGKGGKSFYGFKVPAWAMKLAPQPGEKMRDYRDRIVPLAQMAMAPQRARVAKTRDDFAMLDAKQRAELDGAVDQTAKAIQDRIMNGVLSGELRPGTFKPMTGIAVARDVLDIIDHGNQRFMSSLTDDQRTKLASHRFDFADYLLFSAKWEDAFKFLDHAP